MYHATEVKSYLKGLFFKIYRIGFLLVPVDFSSTEFNFIVIYKELPQVMVYASGY